MIFKRLVYIVMTVLVLFAGSGQTIYAHTCLKTGRTTLAFTNATCCHKKAVKNEQCSFKKPSCCQVNAAFSGQVVPATVQASGQIKVSVIPVFVQEIFNVFNPLQSVIVTDVFGLVPEPFGKSDILFTRVFRC